MATPQGRESEGGTSDEPNLDACAELAIPVYRVTLTPVPGVSIKARPEIRTTIDAARILGACIGLATDREHLVAAFLDLNDRVLGVMTLGIGDATRIVIHTREVFRPAILIGAASLVLAHNHPSGDPLPSDADLFITRELHAVGMLLGIRLFDHLILGHSAEHHVSLRLRGLAVPAWRDELRRVNATVARRAARLQAANTRLGSSASAKRTAALRAALWRCRHCRRRQLQRRPQCRYCGAPRDDF